MFFGFIPVKAYDYWWGYTKAQIELMTIDRPLVVYKDKDKKPVHTKKEMDDLMKQWEEKKRKEREGKAKKVDINEFLKGNKEEENG